MIQKIIEILTRRTQFTPTQYTSKHLSFYFYIIDNRIHSFQNIMIFDLWNVRWIIKTIFWIQLAPNAFKPKLHILQKEYSFHYTLRDSIFCVQLKITTNLPNEIKDSDIYMLHNIMQNRLFCRQKID